MAKEKKEKEVEWKLIPPERYREVMAELVHFSFKTVNSNIAAGGVRLGQADIMRLPYLSVRALLGGKHPLGLDYQKNTGNIATVAKQIGMAKQNQAPADEGAEILAMLAAATGEAASFGMESVSPRMRQLLLPRQPVPAPGATSDYVAVSPVGCGGLNALVNTAVAAHNEQVKSAKGAVPLVRIKQANLPFGGANPQNVGSLVRAMQTPMFFSPPQENPEIRKALALHHKGAEPRLPVPLMQAWFDWFNLQKLNNQGQTQTNLKTREKEADFARQVMLHILRQGQYHYECLVQWRQVLPVPHVEDDAGNTPVSLLSEDVKPLIRGWIEPAFRDWGWKNDFAAAMSRKVSDYSFDEVDGYSRRLPIQHGAEAISQAMLEVLS
jgi:hypothetical protein